MWHLLQCSYCCPHALITHGRLCMWFRNARTWCFIMHDHQTCNSFHRTHYAECGICHRRVCPSVCRSQASTVPKQLNAGSHIQCHMVAQVLQFNDAKELGAKCKCDRLQSAIFNQYLARSQKWCMIGTWTAKKLLCALPNGDIFRDLKWP